MKAIQIEKLLTTVFENFLETITDEKIKETVKSNAFIAGGCIPSMLMDEWVNDYDIYFTSKVIADAVREYYYRIRTNELLKTSIKEEVVTDDYTKIVYKDEVKNSFRPVFITKNAITLTDKIQLITKFTGDPWDVIKNFDWAHLRSYYKYPKLHLDPDVYRLITEKDLVYTGSAYPLSSMMRMQKYTKKGWKISAVDQLKIALEMAKLDLADLEVLKEQMTGIDPTYMLNIWDKIESKKWEIDDLLLEIDRVTR